MPKAVTVMGRSSSITNSFVNGVIPARFPTGAEVAEALSILGLDAADLRCAYCGDRSTEWDHFRPLIHEQEPTGYISEVANLVPACGKCNQSKGNSHWRTWMLGNARLCPRIRCIPDLADRVERLARFEQWREPTKLDIAELVGEELWVAYRSEWRNLLDSMRESQRLALQVGRKLRAAVDALHPGALPPRRRATVLGGGAMTSEERIALIHRVRSWARRPRLNVHRIIAIVVRAGGAIGRSELIREAARITRSKSAPGAIANLLTSKGNAYGRIFEARDGVIHLHPEVEAEIRAHVWVGDA